MSEILELAKNHFTSIQKELNEIEVPEWIDDNGNPTKIYFKNSMNLAQSGEIMKLSRTDPAKSLVQKLIYKALDANGKPLFRQIEMTELLRSVDSDIIGGILIKMDELTEDAETLKNA